MEVETYKIPACNMHYLQQKVDKLNKRANKLNLSPMSIVRHEEVVEEKTDHLGLSFKYISYMVSIDGESPVLNGWKLVARLTPQDNGEILVKSVPGEDCPTKYREADPLHCDHCLTRRKRKDVFILNHEDGRFVQVGRNCIADFLGNVSPDAILRYATFLDSLTSFCGVCKFCTGGRPYLCPTQYAGRPEGARSRLSAAGGDPILQFANLS